MEKEIILELQARDFKGTEFVSTIEGNCALEKAAKRQFNPEYVSEVVDGINLNEHYYSHEYYGTDSFNTDSSIAQSHNFDETVIRKISLIKYGSSNK